MAEEFAVIGKPGLIDKQAVMIVTGKLDFAEDNLPGEKLHGRILGSPHAHARILSIDTSKAEELEGVKAVVTYKDGIGFVEELTWWGQEVAAVIATEPDIAEDAIDLIEVEYEPLPFVIDPDEAMESDAPLVGCWPDSNVKTGEKVRGDVEAGLDKADVIVEDTVGWTNYFQMSTIETRLAVAWWVGDHVYMRVPTPNVANSRAGMASFLGLPLNKVHLVSHGSGMIVGDKIFPGNAHYIAATLSKSLGQPVQMQYSRREHFLCSQHQHKAKATIKIGAKNDGTITAIDATFYADDGGLGSTWASDLSFPIRNTLRCPDARFAYVEIATNTPWAFIYRSVQCPPGDFLMEVVLDELAEELGMNPLALRLKNAVTPEEVQQDNGKPYSSNGVIECLNTVAEAIGWNEKWHAPGTKTQPDGRLHGIGIAGCVESHSSAGPVVGGIINLTRDGKAICNQGITRVGCGTNSGICAIVAETLGMSYEDVTTGEWGNLDVAAEAAPQWGSQGLINNGAAFLRAAEDARDQLFERAAPLLEVSVDKLGIGDGKVFVKADPSKSKTIAELCAGGSPIVGRGYGWTQVLQRPLFDWPVGTPCETRCQCASATEVAVDPETGEVEILNIVDSVDAGRVISLGHVQKQIYAGIESIAAQALYWDQILDPETGATLNPNFLDHKWPTPLDLHQDRFQAKPVESIDACGPYGAKGIGEPVITTYESIFGAIHNATGKWFKEVPVYPWRILKALGKA